MYIFHRDLHLLSRNSYQSNISVIIRPFHVWDSNKQLSEEQFSSREFSAGDYLQENHPWGNFPREKVFAQHQF